MSDPVIVIPKNTIRIDTIWAFVSVDPEDGRPPLDDDRDYVWNKISKCWCG